MNGESWEVILSGGIVTIRRPGWHAYMGLIGAVMFGMLFIIAAARMVRDGILHNFQDAGDLLPGAIILSVIMLLAVLCGRVFFRMRSVYEFSDRGLRETEPGGRVKSVTFKNLMRMEVSPMAGGDVAISRSGARISIPWILPEYLVIRTFCFAAVALRRYNAEGESLADRFASAISTHGEVTFREHREAAIRIVFLLVLMAIPVFMIGYALFLEASRPHWWRVAGVLTGLFMAVSLMGTIWDLLRNRSQTLTLHREGIHLVDGKGRKHSATWEEISELRLLESDRPGIRLKRKNGRPLPLISAEFRELYAIRYFVERMLAEATVNSGTKS